jgi:hypothetical protein
MITLLATDYRKDHPMLINKDQRGVEWTDEIIPVDALPAGWAQCGTCGISWNDAKPTGWTPAPSGRCPFEYDHDEYDEEA